MNPAAVDYAKKYWAKHLLFAPMNNRTFSNDTRLVSHISVTATDTFPYPEYAYLTNIWNSLEQLAVSFFSLDLLGEDAPLVVRWLTVVAST
jgi:hypothetical protein